MVINDGREFHDKERQDAQFGVTVFLVSKLVGLGRYSLQFVALCERAGPSQK